jgi:arylsulfatase A-like enzyme
MRILTILFLAVAAVLLGVTPALAQSRSPLPNIILIIADDHGWPYSGFMGNDIVETPNLDRLAHEGVVFVNGYAPASVCQPSLQTLLTGLHPVTWSRHRAEIEASLGRKFEARTEVTHFQTLPRQLARRGYRSFQGGKHWEGSSGMAGFDAGTQMDISACPTLDSACQNQLTGWQTFGRPGTGELWEFLDEDEGTPFLVWFAPRLPHSPMDAPLDYLCRYWPPIWQAAWGCEVRPFDLGLSGPAIRYYANVSRFDDVLGDLLAGLEARGLRESTLLIYVSDNGYEQEPHAPTGPWGDGVGGARGKLSMYELGFRTPIIFSWPGQVPSGVRHEDLTSFEDVYATILDFAGIESPPDRQGHSVKLLANGDDSGGAWEDHRIVGMYPTLRGATRLFLRTPEWHYIRRSAPNYVEELYNVGTDPFEHEDVTLQHPDLVEDFRVEAEDWYERLLEPVDYMEVSGRLVAPEGLPVPLVRVSLHDPSRRTFLVTTSASNGSFRFPRVAAGQYTLRVARRLRSVLYDGREMEQVSLDLRERATGPYLPLQIEAGEEPFSVTTQSQITVQIRNPDGTPAEGAEVHLWGRSMAGPRITWRDYTNAEGVFRADALPAGQYKVRCRVPGHHRTTPLRRVRLDEGDRAVIEITSPRRVPAFRDRVR